jgi:hypothetical protein
VGEHDADARPEKLEHAKGMNQKGTDTPESRNNNQENFSIEL